MITKYVVLTILVSVLDSDTLPFLFCVVLQPGQLDQELQGFVRRQYLHPFFLTTVDPKSLQAQNLTLGRQCPLQATCDCLHAFLQINPRNSKVESSSLSYYDYFV